MREFELAEQAVASPVLSTDWYSIVDRVKELIKYKGYQGMSPSLDPR